MNWYCRDELLYIYFLISKPLSKESNLRVSIRVPKSFKTAQTATQIRENIT